MIDRGSWLECVPNTPCLQQEATKYDVTMTVLQLRPHKPRLCVIAKKNPSPFKDIAHNRNNTWFFFTQLFHFNTHLSSGITEKKPANKIMFWG